MSQMNITESISNESKLVFLLNESNEEKEKE